MLVFKMRGSVPIARYSSICNVLRQWKTSLIPIYRVYRLYDICIHGQSIWSRGGPRKRETLKRRTGRFSFNGQYNRITDLLHQYRVRPHKQAQRCSVH